MSPTITFLVQAMIIVGLPPLLWHAARVRGVLPLAVVQKVVGIALGPSLLGVVSPTLFAGLFPAASVAALATVANLAVILFAFTLGAHLDLAALRGRGRAVVQISAGAAVFPTLLGIAVGWWLAARFPAAIGAAATRGEFAVGIGLCVGVTALPVLGAILREMNLLGERVGQVALRCAALNDAVLWVLLALLLGSVARSGQDGGMLRLGLGGPLYLLAAGFVAAPLLRRAAARAPFGERHLVLLSVAAIASASATELLGLHYVLGAFVAGVIVPAEWRAGVLARLEMAAATVLLPFFFVITGLRVRLDPFAAQFGTIALATLGAALVGKVAGTAVPARLAGERWGDAFALGALMQAKGLVEVVVLTILMDSRAISPDVFSALVAMTIVNDMLCMPLARLGLGRAAAALPMQMPAP